MHQHHTVGGCFLKGPGYLGDESLFLPGRPPPRASSCKLSEGMNRQIFFDPQRKRWKRLRRILDAVAVVSTVILVLFFLNVLKKQQLPELLLPTPKRNYRAIQEQAAAIKAKYLRSARRKTSRKPSEIPFNSGEGLRAAYYVDDDAGSYASLKNHIHQIDILFPVWLYVSTADGTLAGCADGRSSAAHLQRGGRARRAQRRPAEQGA